MLKYITRLSEIINEAYRRLILKLYYEPDGECKRCPFCGCTKINSIVRDRIEGFVLEEEFFCAACGKSVQYWAYGHFSPYEDYVFTDQWYTDNGTKNN